MPEAPLMPTINLRGLSLLMCLDLYLRDIRGKASNLKRNRARDNRRSRDRPRAPRFAARSEGACLAGRVHSLRGFLRPRYVANVLIIVPLGHHTARFMEPGAVPALGACDVA